ncbi:hypothetical protein ACFSSF_00610 [Dietzia aerolata]|uniref:hypothetical protein n=1 Tax=Dietzia aerolata TaxID=595984 RepID=UPI00363C51B6
MRAVTIALAAIPVVFGGLGLAAISGALDPLMPPSTVADDSHLGPDATHTSESAANSGTSIDGRRPHLSVIDGYANFALPVHISGILSLLPVADADLAPLPSAEGRDDDTESAGTSWNAPDEASPHVGTPAAPVAPPVRDYSPSGAEPTIANQAPSPSRPMPPTLPSHSPLGGGGGDWQRPIQESLRAPESQASRTEEQISNARPPHAGVPGRPRMPTHRVRQRTQRITTAGRTTATQAIPETETETGTVIPATPAMATLETATATQARAASAPTAPRSTSTPNAPTTPAGREARTVTRGRAAGDDTLHVAYSHPMVEFGASADHRGHHVHHGRRVRGHGRLHRAAALSQR